MDAMTLVLFGLAAVMIVFMMVSNNKRKKQAAETQEKLVPGAEVLTGFGVYGTIISMDREGRKAEVEIAPGVTVTIDPRYAGSIVPEPIADTADESKDHEAPEIESIPESTTEKVAQEQADDAEPEFGQRIEDPSKPSQKSDD